MRVALLRMGYAGLGLAFAGIAASVYAPTFLLPALALAIVGAILLAFSADDLPKWAGIALLAYFALTVLAFVAATPITIDKGDGYFVNSAPTLLAQEAFSWLTIAAPLMLAGTAALASWEREAAPRVLLIGAIAGFVLVGALTVALVPEIDEECAVDPEAPGCEGAAQRAAAEGRQQGDMLRLLTAVSAAAGAAGALWAAGRADEYA